MKKSIKFILILMVVFFALINYRLFSFQKGFSKTNLENKSVLEVLETVKNIEKVEYYEKIIKSEDYSYSVYILTSDDAYLLDATKEDIEGFKIIGVFSNKLNPEKISPIPFYVEVIIGLIILFIPSQKGNKSKG